MACLFGHKWNGCKCVRCGVTRDKQHDWNGCICKICGKTSDNHIWNDTEGSRYAHMTGLAGTQAGCKCIVCGKIRDFRYVQWNGGRKEVDCHTYENSTNANKKICSVCGKGRNLCSEGIHQYEKDVKTCKGKCIGCGKYDDQRDYHSYNQVDPCTFVCSVCGYVKKQHTFTRDEGSPDKYEFVTYNHCLYCGAPNPQQDNGNTRK